MPRWQLAYLAGCFAVLGGSLFYVLCDFGGWPLLTYEPYENIWMVASEPPSASAMVYPGMLLWGLTGAFASAAACLLIASRVAWRPSDSALQLIGGWAITASAFAATYFLWGLWPF